MKKSISPFGMMYQLFADAKPHMKLILLIIVMGISTMIFTFIGVLIAMPLFSLSYEELQVILEKGFQGSDLNLLRFFQAVQTLGLFVIPALLANNFLLSEKQGFLATKQKSNYLVLGLIFLLSLVAALPLIQSLISLNGAITFPEAMKEIEARLIEMESERSILSERMVSELSVGALLLNILIIAILPAIGEEFLFRGVLQRILQQWTGKAHLSVIFAAVIFSAIHMQFYGFIPRILLGIYFGYIFLWTGNIWLTVLAHFLNNAMAIMLIYLSENNIFELPLWFGDRDMPAVLPLIISVILTTALIFLTKKISTQKQKTLANE